MTDCPLKNEAAQFQQKTWSRKTFPQSPDKRFTIPFLIREENKVLDWVSQKSLQEPFTSWAFLYFRGKYSSIPGVSGVTLGPLHYLILLSLFQRKIQPYTGCLWSHFRTLLLVEPPLFQRKVRSYTGGLGSHFTAVSLLEPFFILGKIQSYTGCLRSHFRILTLLKPPFFISEENSLIPGVSGVTLGPFHSLSLLYFRGKYSLICKRRPVDRQIFTEVLPACIASIFTAEEPKQSSMNITSLHHSTPQPTNIKLRNITNKSGGRLILLCKSEHDVTECTVQKLWTNFCRHTILGCQTVHNAIPKIIYVATRLKHGGGAKFYNL
jgi:hypothetical protein